MGRKPVNVELIFAKGCSKCAEAREALRDAALSAGDVEWIDVDIAAQPERAVDLGVVSTPAVAINGKLVFASMPTSAELRKAIRSAVPQG